MTVLKWLSPGASRVPDLIILLIFILLILYSFKNIYALPASFTIAGVYCLLAARYVKKNKKYGGVRNYVIVFPTLRFGYRYTRMNGRKYPGNYKDVYGELIGTGIVSIIFSILLVYLLFEGKL